MKPLDLGSEVSKGQAASGSLESLLYRILTFGIQPSCCDKPKGHGEVPVDSSS